MSETRNLKKKGKPQYGTLTLPSNESPIFDEFGNLNDSNKRKGNSISGSWSSGGQRNKFSSQTSYQGNSQESGRTGGYDIFDPRSKESSLESLASGSSDEIFVRDSASSGVSGHYSIHCHSVLDEPVPDNSAVIKLILASVLSLIFMIGEYVGGYYSSSLAVTSDAGHLFSDFCGFAVSLIALVITSKPASQKMNFGYYRAEILGSVASVMIVWVMTGLLVYAAIQRLITETPEIDADIMIIMACISIVVNIMIALILHTCGCHGNFYGAATKDIPQKGNFSMRGALFHSIIDVLMSISVLVVGVIIKIMPEYKIADPILTFVFGLFVVLLTLPALKDITWILMEGTPRDISYSSLLSDLEGLPGVRTVHSLSIWCLSVDKNALTVHLGVDHSFDSEIVLEEAKRTIRSNYSVVQSTIQVERYDKEMDSCEKCQPLSK